jgi:hypothetical protein
MGSWDISVARKMYPGNESETIMAMAKAGNYYRIYKLAHDYGDKITHTNYYTCSNQAEENSLFRSPLVHNVVLVYDRGEVMNISNASHVIHQEQETPKKIIAPGTKWYFAEDLGKHLRQVVIEIPAGGDTKSQFGHLMLGEKYHNLVTVPRATGFFSLESDPGPFLLVRTDSYVVPVRSAPKKIGFSFFKMNSSGILGIYIYIDSDQMRKISAKEHPYLEIGYGLDMEDGVKRIKDAFSKDSITMILADKSDSFHHIIMIQQRVCPENMLVRNANMT